MKVCLVLGCWGRERNGIVICSGIENEILDVTVRSGRNLAIVDHLDKQYGMLDRPLYENVHTAIFGVKNKFDEVGKPVFSDAVFQAIEDFCVIHRKCGVYLRLDLKEESDGK